MLRWDRLLPLAFALSLHAFPCASTAATANHPIPVALPPSMYDVLDVFSVDGPDVGQYTNIVALNEGGVFIAYCDEGLGRLKGAYLNCSLTNTSSADRSESTYPRDADTLSCDAVEVVVIDDGLSIANESAGRFVSMTLTDDGNPMFAYNQEYRLKYAVCDSPQCGGSVTRDDDEEIARASMTQSSTVHVDRLRRALDTSAIYHSFLDNSTATSGASGGYTSIVASAKGLPMVAYFDDQFGSLMLARCFDLNCMSFDLTTLVANSTSPSYVTGKYASIALDATGHPIVSYYSSSNNTAGTGSLWFVRCVDTNCFAKVTPRLIDDSSIDVGRYTNLKLGHDGLPVMMYTDESNGYMKTCHCFTSDCDANGLTISVVDRSIGYGAYGEFPHLTISPYSPYAPVMSYFNQTSPTQGSLMLAQCLTPTCSESVVQVISTGVCGYGRDSSLAFAVDNNLLYISFMYYSPFNDKLCMVAVLSPSSSPPPTTTTSARGAGASSHQRRHRQVIDICQPSSTPTPTPSMSLTPACEK